MYKKCLPAERLFLVFVGGVNVRLSASLVRRLTPPITLQIILRAQAAVVQIADLRYSGSTEKAVACGLSRTPNENFRSTTAVVDRNAPNTPGTRFAPQHLGQ